MGRLRTFGWWLRPRTRRDSAEFVANSESYRAFRRASNPISRYREDPEEVRLKRLKHPIYLRPGSTDAGSAFISLREDFHLPTTGPAPRLIWDLGANIGATMVDMAARYPTARIIGIELDPRNAAIARRNIGFYGKRCELIQAAVWSSDGEVTFASNVGAENASRVTNGGTATVEAISLNTLLAKGAPDFVKMDIEGAEQRVLTENTEWAEHPTGIAVECHGDYSPAACVQDLVRLRFDAEVREGWIDVVVGRRVPPTR